MDEALRLEGIRRVYRAGTPAELVVLDDVNLTVSAGERVALVAPSGAGKSTLLHIAGLLDTPTSGSVAIGGTAATGLPDRARTQLRRDTIGFVYQMHHLLPEFSAQENVVLPQRAAGRSAAQAAARASELLTAVGLSPRADHRPAELSGGEQQRVALCRALANGPRLLLADEPTGNLDPASGEAVFDTLTDLARRTGLAVLMATHNLDLASRLDRIVRLDAGGIA